MNKILLAATMATMMACGCTPSTDSNPLLQTFDTPYGIPPFEKIEDAHYLPAFEKAMKAQKDEIEAIATCKDAPTFENTVLALDRSGQLLSQVASVFFAQDAAATNAAMQEVDAKVSPMLATHQDEIMMDSRLWERVKTVYEQRKGSHLDAIQQKLVEETYKEFVRSGANLDKQAQERLKELNNEIALLETTFSQHMLAETNAYQLVINNKDSLEGLPADLVASAAEAAEEAGKKGSWMFTLHNPSVMPFLQYSACRDLRRDIFEAYTQRGCHGGENDNRQVVARLVEARLEKARLMGYPDYASMALERRMAKQPVAVYNLLDQVWKPALEVAAQELEDIRQEARKDGLTEEPEGWDWRYYADRAKQAKYSFDENQLRPYLQLENVREGLFYCANRLYGLQMKPLQDVPLPHPDAQAYECTDAQGQLLGVLFMDFFPRASKRGGAWCTSYRDLRYTEQGERIVPIISIVCNFTKPAAGEPALLNVDETRTMFHEFGHALHGFFTDVPYKGLSDVPRDFVELPSQINEHWAFAPEVLQVYATHYKTGEVLPQELVEQMERSQKYGQGFATVEYLAASYLDMDFHTLAQIPDSFDVMQFEQSTLQGRGLPRQIPSRYRTTYFNHTMGGGYTAGYYSYLWAEVLESDGFEAFRETGDIFSPTVAQRFRQYVLTPGGTRDAMDMYVGFRGHKPGIEPLLRGRFGDRDDK